MSTTDTRAAFEEWHTNFYGRPFRLGQTDQYKMDSTQGKWQAWQAATEAAKATGTAGELPPLPEMESIADMPRAQKVPPDWDGDYTSIWQKWQVAERNKMQWRAYALQLRIAIAATAAPVLSDEQYKKLEYIAHWMDSSVRYIQNAPDDCGPASQFDYDMGQAAHEILSILAATRSQP